MRFLKGVMHEMKQTTWTSGPDVNKYTWTVVSTVIIFGVYFAAVDFGLDELLTRFIH
ncbi:preprotein translocase subunit SecE [Atopobacter phocae]|uniref:preprotein translocase subunit SecE n=1 Tax=Atopobacter phocae TaxID=136492 RepID=UPI0004B0C09C|nr:preprotein translocase subunit SecE [Atopobacter phocae]